MADIIDVNIGDSTLEVFWQDEVELNLDLALMYIKSGQAEIQNYVDNVSKPEITNYVETEAKPLVTQIVEEIAEPTVAEYIETTVKPEIDEYTDSLKPDLEAYATQANASAIASAASAAEAKESENNALSSKNSAATSAQNAANSATVAKEYAQDAATSANLANIENKITNCITKIPQDIKLELNNGTLTLKAGSKVYVPNGVGIFDEVTVESDKSWGQTTYASGNIMLFYRSKYNDLFALNDYACYSGSSAPTAINNMIWYDTANGKIKWTNNKGSTWNDEGLSLPLNNSPYSNGKGFTSIDQVFNGFGYIGSYIYGINVEGKAANGNNPDGSINNLTYKIDGINGALDNDRGVHKYILLHQNALIHANSWYEQEERPNFVENRDQYWYNPKTRETFYYRSATNNGIRPAILVGEYDIDTNGKIYNFKTKSTFQAIDYYDFKQLDDNAAKLDKDNVFTGTNTLNSTSPMLNGKNTTDLTNADGMGLTLRGIDGAGNLWSYIDLYRRGTIKSTEAWMYARNKSGAVCQIGVVINDNGAFSTYAPTPPTSDNSTQIATTAWVRSSIGVQFGTIIAFAGSSAPTGYLACNGAAVSRTTYSTLFNVIGTRWGSGDGSTTFNLPNLNSGRFLRGNSSAGGYNNAGLPNITGSFQVKAGASVTDWAGSFFAGESIVADRMGGAGVYTNVTQFSAQKSSSIYGASSTVMPLSANVLFCIKY